MKKNKHSIILYTTLGLGVLAAGCFWLYILFGPSRAEPAKNNQQRATSTFDYPYQSQLDGTGVMAADDVMPEVVGIMIDNHPDARPERGLSLARVVYEVPVEGSYTRYLGIFALTDSVNVVGPVRSARPYFISILSEYGLGWYYHSGGSPEALDILSKGKSGVHDVNEFWHGTYFWRDDARSAPHNLFTKSELWQRFAANNTDASSTQPVWKGWSFVTSSGAIASVGQAAASLAIPYATDYLVSWQYDATSSRYSRFENSKPHVDENGGTVAAATVVVQYANISTIDDYGRRAVTVFGSGKADVYTAGRLVRGSWTRSSGGRTQFVDAFGSAISFAPGPVWVEVVPAGMTIKN